MSKSSKKEEQMTKRVLDLKEEKRGLGQSLWQFINENLGRLGSERTANTYGMC